MKKKIFEQSRDAIWNFMQCDRVACIHECGIITQPTANVDEAGFRTP